MRLPQHPLDVAILSTLIFPLLTSAINLQCDHVRVNGISWDLSALGGPHSVKHTFELGDSRERNSTYTIDICQPLKKKKKGGDGTECPNNTRICAVDHVVSGDKDVPEATYPIAGDLKEKGGGNINAKWTRLKGSTSHEDSKKEGLSLELGGGFKQTDTGKKQPQMAIIEFRCDKTREGLEGMPDEKDQYEKRISKREDAPNEPLADDKTPSLTFESYGDSEAIPNMGLLRLTWRTKWACEDAKEQKDKERSSHWGFFTWFILIAFLSIAAYLIFGSWLNYNRYGARGWDLLPHGDTIRDVPYLVKDVVRRVVNGVQGGGSRGGYAAV